MDNPGEFLPDGWGKWTPDENGNINPNTGRPDGSLPFNPPLIIDTNAVSFPLANWNGAAVDQVLATRFKQFAVRYNKAEVVELIENGILVKKCKLILKPPVLSPVFRIKFIKVNATTVSITHEALEIEE